MVWHQLKNIKTRKIYLIIQQFSVCDKQYTMKSHNISHNITIKIKKKVYKSINCLFFTHTHTHNKQRSSRRTWHRDGQPVLSRLYFIMMIIIVCLMCFHCLYTRSTHILLFIIIMCSMFIEKVFLFSSTWHVFFFCIYYYREKKSVFDTFKINSKTFFSR